ncbi:MAG: chorismate mutase [Candidatus Bathyarchaeota archaeon]|nr:chorismate mutase [Candidatus Bathyarchaeota archaeon]
MVEELAKLRKIIDEIDCKLARLLIERLKVVGMVAEIKREHNLDVYDVKRVEEVLANVRKVAENENFNPEVVEEVYRLIVNYCVKLEEKLLGLNVNA